MKNIKNIIFDFGDVLYEINHTNAIDEFSKLSKSINNFYMSLELNQHIQIIQDYESGKIDNSSFRKNMKKLFHLNCTDIEFDKAWNSILISILPFSINLVSKLKKKYKLYLLSNTNDIHYKHFAPECKQLFALFDKCYFSYEIGFVKPSPEIFHILLNETNISSNETLFIDDSKPNIATASLLDFNTFLVENRNTQKVSEILYYE